MSYVPALLVTDFPLDAYFVRTEIKRTKTFRLSWGPNDPFLTTQSLRDDAPPILGPLAVPCAGLAGRNGGVVIFWHRPSSFRMVDLGRALAGALCCPTPAALGVFHNCRIRLAVGQPESVGGGANRRAFNRGFSAPIHSSCDSLRINRSAVPGVGPSWRRLAGGARSSHCVGRR